MSVIQRVKKPTTHKGKKILIKREPQVNEGPKCTLFFHGRNSSERVRGLMKDLLGLKKPDATNLTRKNDITIFENVTPVEQFCRKYETPLFVMGSHSKKRPDNLVIGRTYDYTLLDMVELQVSSFLPMSHFATPKVSLGSKPSLIFQGGAWESNPRLQQLKSILIDLFHREKVDSIRLQGLEHAISFTATDPAEGEDTAAAVAAEGEQVLMRSYKVLLKKSGARVPRIEVEEMGPRVDFTLRRAKLAAEDLMRQALRTPREAKVGKKKNVTTDGLGTTHGRIHLGKQDVGRLQTRKMKGLRKTVEERRQQKLALKRKLGGSSGDEGDTADIPVVAAGAAGKEITVRYVKKVKRLT